MKRSGNVPQQGKPKYAMYSVSPLHPDGVHGPHYVEDRAMQIPVPDWVDSSGWSYLRSSLQVHLLRIVQNPETPDDFRSLMLDLLCRLNPSPVAPQRWFVRSSIYERAQDRQRSTHEEVADAVGAALCIVEPSSSPERSFEANLRQELNDTVTEDFLGSGWRERLEDLSEPPQAEGTPESHFLEQLEEGDRRTFFAELRKDLSERQKELLAALQDGIRPQEWAKAQGLANATVDVMMYKIRHKGRKVVRRMKL